MLYLPPLTLFVIGWLSGIAVAPLVKGETWVWLTLGLGAVGAAVVGRSYSKSRTGFIMLACACFGGARFLSAQPSLTNPNFIAAYNDRDPLTLEGVVIEEPEGRDAVTNLRVQVEKIKGVPTEGVILIQSPRYPPIEFGAKVRAYGLPQTPTEFEDFSYREFLARQGVYSAMYRARIEVVSGEPTDFWTAWRVKIFKPIFAFKAQALAAILRTFPEPQGALISGILFGVDANIPESLQNAFRVTGTSHIVAISGFNISIVAGIVSMLFRKIFSERKAIVFALIAIWIYAIIAGASASVIRAALMGSLVLIANGFKRPTYGLNSLAIAALLMTLFNPNTFWDVGFQLSASATLGLILYAEPLAQAATQFLSRFTTAALAQKIISGVGEFSLLTLAAQLTTLPLIAYYFQQISLVSLLANLLVLPAQPAVMVLSGLATLGAMLNPTLGWLLYWLAYPFITFTIVIIENLARIPFASIPLNQFDLPFLISLYVALFGLTWLVIQRPTWLNASFIDWLKNLGVAATVITAFILWQLTLRAPDGNLYVTFFDVGQGESILIQTPNGRYVLIDGGPSANRLAETLGRELPFGTRELDLIISASPTNENVTGLTAVLDRYQVNQVVLAGEPTRSNAYKEWVQKVAQKNIHTLTATPRQTFELGEGAMLTVTAVNQDGASLQLTYGNASFYLPIGALHATPVKQLRPATIMLVPNNGALDAINKNEVTALNPYTFVISVGAGNPSGDPQPETLTLLSGRTVLRTDQHGAIKFGTDGIEVWAESER